jgi:hypothetical protein
MKKLYFLCLVLVLLLFIAPPLSLAKPKVRCEITKISQHHLLVSFSWRVTVYSDKAWDGCDLKISFRDKSGKEIHLIHDVLRLKVGPNEYSGMDICGTQTWEQIDKYVTTLDCVF